VDPSFLDVKSEMVDQEVIDLGDSDDEAASSKEKETEKASLDVPQNVMVNNIKTEPSLTFNAEYQKVTKAVTSVTETCLAENDKVVYPNSTLQIESIGSNDSATDTDAPQPDTDALLEHANNASVNTIETNEQSSLDANTSDSLSLHLSTSASSLDTSNDRSPQGHPTLKNTKIMLNSEDLSQNIASD
jgi:hypothetical protein